MAGFQPGGHATIRNLDDEQYKGEQSQLGWQGPFYIFTFIGEAIFMSERGPKAQAKQRKGKQQVDCQVEVTDRRTVHEAARNHDPTGERLSDEEQSHRKVNTKFPKGNFPRDEKVEHRNGIHQPGKAGDETMDPFDVEDIFILLQRHIEIDLFEFWRLLVFAEFLFPGLLTERRNGSADGIPFGDRETRSGEADKAAKDDKKRHNEGKRKQPNHHAAVGSLWH